RRGSGLQRQPHRPTRFLKPEDGSRKTEDGSRVSRIEFVARSALVVRRLGDPLPMQDDLVLRLFSIDASTDQVGRAGPLVRRSRLPTSDFRLSPDFRLLLA